MVKYITIFLLISSLLKIQGQELNGFGGKSQDPNEIYLTKGVLKASATISPGLMLHNGSRTVYLTGYLEYLIDKSFSLRGDVFQFISDINTTGTLVNPTFQNRLFFGAFHHFGKGNLRWQNGFQMGLTATEFQYDPWYNYYKWHFAPSLCLKSGLYFYIWKYFHFFAEINYVNSSLRGTSIGTVVMDEFIFSGGLGFQLPTKCKTTKFRGTVTPSF